MADIQKLIDTIKNEEVKPKASWQFKGLNQMAWVSYAIFIIIGGFAFSIILFAIQQSEFRMLDHMQHSSLELLLSFIPIIWLFFILLFLILSIYTVTGTWKGYKIPLFQLVAINLFISITMGTTLFLFGGAKFLEKQFDTAIPIYESIEERKIASWSNPEAGMLSGKIIEVEEFNLKLEDFKAQTWTIEIADSAFIANPVQLVPGETIKLIGQIESKLVFTTREIRPWGRRRHDQYN